MSRPDSTLDYCIAGGCGAGAVARDARHSGYLRRGFVDEIAELGETPGIDPLAADLVAVG
jgi:hypothetical protein